MTVMEFSVTRKKKASLTNFGVKKKRELDIQMHSFDGQNALVGVYKKNPVFDFEVSMLN